MHALGVRRMRSDQEYAHEVTYESINNPAFAHYPGERDPAQPRVPPGPQLLYDFVIFFEEIT